MDATASQPCLQLNTGCSFKRCCYFLLTFLLLIVVIPGVTVLVIVFVLKPQKPLFSLQRVKLDSYKLDVESEKDLFVSSLLSFNLTAANPNKFGISYSTSRFHILNDGITIGMIRVLRFYQPPKSKGISVPAQVIFECVNVSKIISGQLTQDNSTNSISQMRILGDVRAQVHILYVTLPKFRVAMDCAITIDHKYLTSLNVVKNQMISLPADSNLLFQKCGIALYV